MIFQGVHFNHKFQIQIRFSDADMMGHVNNACYFNYVENGRLDYYGHVVGFDSDWYRQRNLIMARFEINYKKAIIYGDTVKVFTKCTRLGNSSFDLSWIIVIERNGLEEIAAEGKTTIVGYNYELRKPEAIPSAKRRSIKLFEKDFDFGD